MSSSRAAEVDEALLDWFLRLSPLERLRVATRAAFEIGVDQVLDLPTAMRIHESIALRSGP